MHRSFKLHPRRQTGKLIHHRHTSYMALLFVMIGSGLCMVLTDAQARAASLSIASVLSTPPPSGAPILTLPAAGSTFTDPTVHFEGICPISEPPAAVALYDSSSLLGSAACRADGTFALDADITPDTRAITAGVVSVSGDAGAKSTPLSIRYLAPAHKTTSRTPVAVLSDQSVIAYDMKTMGAWKGYFVGGVAPYTVTVDWGDGKTQSYENVSGEQQTFLHGYTSSSAREVMITVRDKTGAVAVHPVAAIGMDSTQETSGFGVLAGSLGSGSLSYLVWLTLFVALLWMWRYEFLTHRKVVAVPVYYKWQKRRTPARKKDSLEN